MGPQRVRGPAPGAPFPVHGGLVERFLGAHSSPDAPRDGILAHALACCAAYAYGDLETVATIAGRLGLPGNGAVRVAQTVDAMLVFSTAYLLQSRCGRVVILCYRGTEPTNLGNWIADADVGSERMAVGGERLRVPSGFHRNMRATRWAVLEELNAALEGRSLLDRGARVESPMEALYVTGHSLGAAMAVLFALSITAREEHRDIAERLRAVYTFGQPVTTGEPLPAAAAELGRRLHRHVVGTDPVPKLPPASWCPLAHFGREWQFADGRWAESATPVAQLRNLPEARRALWAVATGAWRRGAFTSIQDHAPHRYIAALQPEGCITELGDRP